MEPEPHAPALADLSADCLLCVFSFLDRSSLVHCASTCKQWRDLSSNHELWRKLLAVDFCNFTHQARASSNDMGCPALLLGGLDENAQLEDTKRLLGDGANSSWRDIYRKRLDVESNWRKGRSSMQVLSGHNDFIRCAQIGGNTLVTASGSISHLDCTIRVWDLDTGNLRQLLRGHMGPIWCMMYDHGSDRIATGADDYTVRYWDAMGGNSVVLQDPDSAVRCIHMDAQSRQLVAGTEFGRLMLWDLDMLDEMLSAGMDRMRGDFERLKKVEPAGPLISARRIVVDGTNHVQALDSAEEGKAISAIQVQGGLCASTSVEPLSRIELWDVSRNSWKWKASVGDTQMMFANCMSFERSLGILVAGCGDKNMRVWDLESHQRLHLLTGHVDDIHAHQFDASMVASAALNGQVRIWDLRSGKCTHVLENDAPVHAFQISGGRLVAGTWDGRVMLWDLGSKKLVKEWSSHSDRIWAVATDPYRIVSAALDRTVCIHSFLPQEAAKHSMAEAAVRDLRDCRCHADGQDLYMCKCNGHHDM